jgi:hypothetical protein
MTRLDLPNAAAKLARAVLYRDASTRSAALIRIGLVAIVWTRFADLLVLSDHVRDGLWPFSIVFYVVSTLACVGLWTRVSMLALAASLVFLMYYVGHVLRVYSNTHHHVQLLVWATVWLAFTPCGVSYSIDRWRAVRRAARRGEPPPLERANMWALRLVALQVSSVYFWTALDKSHLGYFSGERIAHLWMYYYAGSDPVGDIPLLRALFHVLGPSVVLLELSLALGLWFTRTRKWLVVPGLVLHGAFYALLHISTFTATMWLLYLAFFDPDEVHRTVDELSGVRTLA